MPAILAISALRVDFSGEEAREVGGCLGHWLSPERRQLLDELGMLRGGLHGSIDLCHQVGRHALRAPQSVPEHEVQSWKPCFGDRRYVRQLRHRCSDMTAKARRLPAWTCCKALPSGATISVVCPPITSVRAGAVPR